MKKGYIYILCNSSFKKLVKIGYTSREPDIRARELSRSVPTEFCVVYNVFIDTDGKKIERKIHEKLKEFHVRGEFFQCSSKDAIHVVESICAHYKNGTI